MAGLGPETVAAVLAACQASSADAADAFGRALDARFQLTVGEARNLDLEQLPAGFDGPGLAIVLQEGESGVLALLPQATGLLPDFAVPLDIVTTNRLNTLAQELGICLLPESNTPTAFRASPVEHLGHALRRSGAAAGAPLVTLQLQSGEKTGELTLIWPAPTPDSVFAVSPARETTSAAPSQTSDQSPPAAPSPAAAPRPGEPTTAGPGDGSPAREIGPDRPRRSITSLEELPSYSRSLLRIQVSVRVTLAAARKPVSQILRLAPGSILQFGKSCDDALVLEVGERPVALGEAVKVNEKFGLRIKEIVMPDERFRNVG